ncbi:tubulin-folding cofactor B [Genypterus blacodes]|uniref:tubulin-folding cofactor B n=1 Tax=Genypterus blacodes TaxID=154954 RepID=UPI003F75BEF9
MMDNVIIVTDPIVSVRITSTASSLEAQRRFNRGISIAEFKGKLEMIVGLPSSCMELELYCISDKFLQKLDDNEALLGSYHVDNDCRINVIDKSGANQGEFTDVSQVEKFEISDDAYAKRSESARSFMKKRQVGRYNDEEVAKKKAEAAAREEEQKVAADAITVGSRCEVQSPGQPTKRGTVMYVGTADFKPGYWVGIKYDEPLGKHDGSVQGRQYFTCDNKYGAFVKPLNVTVGDFPVEDYDLDEI